MPRWEVDQLGDPTTYSDRVDSPEVTVARVWPYLADLGITRLARQTGLDRLGIPCWAAFRPNSRSLAGSQGKGLTDAAACASAVMEAVEVAVAERPSGPRILASAASLTAEGVAWVDPTRFLPFGSLPDGLKQLTWLEGRNLATGAPVWTPLDVVSMDGEQSELDGICKSSNGLASGNTEDEAIFHALCELIERDATTLWSMLPVNQRAGTVFAARDLHDPAVNVLAAQIEAAGLKLCLLDQSSDLGVPVVMALIGPSSSSYAGYLDVAAGYGAHPVAARAALRAITEAAQSRITAIASSRDDISGPSFLAEAAEEHLAYLTASPRVSAPKGVPDRTSLPDLLDLVQSTLAKHMIDAVAVRVDDGKLPFAVVKVIAPALEDRDANLNWRPSSRALEAMLAA